MGYTEPTPIQSQAIPLILDGRDIVGCAQTGTGKTAAFMLPLMQLTQPKPGAATTLIVTPTRELAVQIERVAKQVSPYTNHRVAIAYGGVGYDPQLKALKKGVDVLVATPGRLIDLKERGAFDPTKIEVLVIDEADRLLDMGFWPQLRQIVGWLPKERQNLLFSATMSSDVLRVIGSTLHEPVEISVAPANTPIEAIEQRVYPVDGQQKADLLVKLIRDNELKRVLVFTRTKHRADRVARVLEKQGIRGAAIHGGRSQSQRQNALDGFARGRYHVLVATDVVARGIDITGISHVVNYDLPNSPEDYVHRIGRTARAGTTGTAMSLMAPEEHETLRDIETKIGSVLECHDHDGFGYSENRMIPNPEREAKRAPRMAFSGGVMSKRGGRRGGGNRKR